MYLIQILLPVLDNDQSPFPHELFRAVSTELADRFGGLTAYTRAPAEGIWRDEQARTSRDEIVVFEVMTESIEEPWWKAYRSKLELDFHQQQVIVRAHQVRLL
jgi:hypothetical protein